MSGILPCWVRFLLPPSSRPQPADGRRRSNWWDLERPALSLIKGDRPPEDLREGGSPELLLYRDICCLPGGGGAAAGGADGGQPRAAPLARCGTAGFL